MKKLLTTLFLLGCLTAIYYYHNDIINYVMYNIVYKDDFKFEKPNEYKRNYKFSYLKEVKKFDPKNQKDILNIIYTGLNNGWDDFTFFCDLKKYEKCLEDVENITNNKVLMSNINNFVATYNSFNKVTVNYNNFGRVNIKIDKLYTDEDIAIINKKIDEIYNELIKDDMSDKEKIKVIHDYIINNTKYDSERSEEIKNETFTDIRHSSNMAYGPLLYGKAICGGYTDTMALFLDKMGIKNYKISSEKHIWNLVYLDNEWKHLDLTWDDPVVNTGIDMLLDTFFLIDTNTLLEHDKTQHTFDTNVFIEAK